MISTLIAWMQEHPILVFVILYLVYRYYQSKQPFPHVEGSKVREIKSKQEFDDLVKECEGCLIVDYYATWCPPCRAAAPVYGEMSKSFDEKIAIFAKVNVDEARDVAAAHAISAMPTFKIFDNTGKELSSIQGWNKSKLDDNIQKATRKQS